ncbi:MAG: pre-16S rRNA-processing nuclease YqgF [Candidatus Muirbacterium halophilum]|nr:pre-16S rRNA-processing nuclease YqgF [Candidatus Muirbacterium halophilum]
MIYIFIDPGSKKFGWAIYKNDVLLEHCFYKKEDFKDFIISYMEKYKEIQIIIGDGTSHKYYCNIIKTDFSDIKIDLINEKYSTEQARKLYFKHNPPKGWKKFIPKSCLVPNEEYDDYTAMILAERYFKNHNVIPK